MFTEEEFLAEWNKLQHPVEEPREYRLHYNEQGSIVMCSMQNHPKDTQYLVVNETTYNSYWKYQIVNGKLKEIDRTPGYRVQLTRSTQGYAVVKNHAGILLENESYEDIEYYATKTN